MITDHIYRIPSISYEKNILIVLILSTGEIQAQDTTKVVYSSEQDTLVKQRLIDRYENVFMTKVPTRHMFKAGLNFHALGLFQYGSSDLSSKSLMLGYEYKLTPSISLGINFEGASYWLSKSGWSGSVTSNVQARWYYDMNRRIAEGKSANNFSGNYFAVVAEKNWQDNDSDLPETKIGLRLALVLPFNKDADLCRRNYCRLD